MEREESFVSILIERYTHHLSILYSNCSIEDVVVEGVVGGLPFELEGGSYVGVDANVEFACDLASEVTLDLHLVEFCVKLRRVVVRGVSGRRHYLL